MTHNLRAINDSIDDKIRTEISLFAEWMHSKLVNREDDLLIKWQEKAPYAEWNHPTHEHILPLFVILGATKSYRKIKRIHSSIDYNSLLMDSYKIG